MPQPPYDRAIALACCLATFEGRWISARCRCQMHTMHPVCLLLHEQPALVSTPVRFSSFVPE